MSARLVSGANDRRPWNGSGQSWYGCQGVSLVVNERRSAACSTLAAPGEVVWM
jgi:hypothetical protein